MGKAKISMSHNNFLGEKATGLKAQTKQSPRDLHRHHNYVTFPSDFLLYHWANTGRYCWLCSLGFIDGKQLRQIEGLIRLSHRAEPFLSEGVGVAHGYCWSYKKENLCPLYPHFVRMPQRYQVGSSGLGNTGDHYFILELGGGTSRISVRKMAAVSKGCRIFHCRMCAGSLVQSNFTGKYSFQPYSLILPETWRPKQEWGRYTIHIFSAPVFKVLIYIHSRHILRNAYARLSYASCLRAWFACCCLNPFLLREPGRIF